MAAATAERGHRRAEAGVTLIEVLVVLVLIGVGAGVAAYAIPSGAGPRDAAQEAALLAARLNLATERSLVEGRDLRLVWSAEGYRFEARDGEEWTSPLAAPLDAPHAVSTDLRLRGPQGGGEVVIDPALLPPGDGVLTLRLGGEIDGRAVVFDGASARVAEARP